MEDTYRALGDRILVKWAEAKGLGQKRLLVAVAGPPGSGKTTLTTRVVDYVRGLASGPSIMCISADGFHFPRRALLNLPNPVEAEARRGAPWTFDGARAAALAVQLRQGGPVSAPTFDHALKDPVEGGVVVPADVEVCVVEGNYVLCDEEPWCGIGDVVDDRWLVRVDEAVARRRVAKRHVEAGIEETMEAALRRADANDLINGEYVMRHSVGCDVLIDSVEERVRG